MAGASRILTPEYRAAQLAGSSRLEGIRVSVDEEKMMASIIRGDLRATDLIENLKAQYSATSRPGLKIVR